MQSIYVLTVTTVSPLDTVITSDKFYSHRKSPQTYKK